jgi:hypothetical protein
LLCCPSSGRKIWGSRTDKENGASLFGIPVLFVYFASPKDSASRGKKHVTFWNTLLTAAEENLYNQSENFDVPSRHVHEQNQSITKEE